MSRVRDEELSFPTMPFLARDKMINDMGNRCDQGAARLYCGGQMREITSHQRIEPDHLLVVVACGVLSHWITVVQPLICTSGEVFSSF
jgi:hypothetical protein